MPPSRAAGTGLPMRRTAATASVSSPSICSGTRRSTPPVSSGSRPLPAVARANRSPSAPPNTFASPRSPTSVVLKTTLPAARDASISRLSARGSSDCSVNWTS